MQTTFAEVMETVERLTVDEKEVLIDILQNRLRENKRRRIIKSVKEARSEFEKGNVKTASVDDIMKGILS